MRYNALYKWQKLLIFIIAAMIGSGFLLDLALKQGVETTAHGPHVASQILVNFLLKITK